MLVLSRELMLVEMHYTEDTQSTESKMLQSLLSCAQSITGNYTSLFFK